MIQNAPSVPLGFENDVSADELFDALSALLKQSVAGEELWLEKQAPHYDIYPPVSAFSEAFTGKDFKKALSSLPLQEAIALNINIPFCQKLDLCSTRHLMATKNHEVISDYLHSVHKEIENIERLFTQPKKITELYFGGGSSNIMSEKDIGLMIGSLARRFDLTDIQEFYMELDPRHITKAQARVLGFIGVTHVNICVLDFDPDVQLSVGRVCSYPQVAEACFYLQNEGIRNIKLDLMYGLPLQSVDSLIDTVQLAVTLKPARISLVPFVQKLNSYVSIEASLLPSQQASLVMENAAREILCNEGYIEIGIDQFSLPMDSLVQAKAEGRLQRRFHHYTQNSPALILGIGAESISTTADHLFQNASKVVDYRQHISRNGFATVRGFCLTREDKLRASIIQELMCALTADLDALCFKNNCSIYSVSEPLKALKPFEETGIICREGNRITIPTLNRMAARTVASVFDMYGPNKDAPISQII